MEPEAGTEEVSLTDLVVIALITLAVVYEFYTLSNAKPFDTISETIWRASANRPLVPFVAGMVAGHWFWVSARCAELLSKCK